MNAMTRIDCIALPTTGSDAGSCLPVLLDALGWRGAPHPTAEAEMDVLDLRNTLAGLGFPTEEKRCRADDPDLPVPCLFVTAEGAPLVLLADGYFDAASRSRRPGWPEGGLGWAYIPVDGEDGGPTAKAAGFRGIAGRFLGLGGQVVLLTLVIDLIALAVPLFTMAVYDKVIAAGDAPLLWAMAGGIGLALLAELGLRLLRGAWFAHMAGRFEMLLGATGLAKLLSLPLARLDTMSAGARLAHLREMEGLRSFFTGPLAMALLELPFSLLFLAVVAGIAGWLALVPAAIATVMALAGLIFFRMARRAALATEAGAAGWRSMAMEIVSGLTVIKAAGQEELWLDRFRQRSARAAQAAMKLLRLELLAQGFGQFVGMAAGAVTLVTGAALAVAGDLSTGTLIAGMVLVWRALAPVQTVFTAVVRLDDVADGIRRFDLLMALPDEVEELGDIPAERRGRAQGRIAFSGVYLRYPGTAGTTLANLSFDLRPGEVVALVGANGSGKSSILKLVAGLYRPQAGMVLLDGIDLRQIAPAGLRRSLAFVPQAFDPFPGSIADYLRFADPLADRDDLEESCARAGILEAVQRLPDGFATSLAAGAGAGVSAGLLQGLGLARAWAADSAIVLLDEPGIPGDEAAEALLLDQIEMLRGRATVLIATHRITHLKIADRVLMLNQGALAFDGKPNDLLARLSGEFK